MKKTKLLTGLCGMAGIAGAIVPLASCSCGQHDPEPEPEPVFENDISVVGETSQTIQTSEFSYTFKLENKLDSNISLSYEKAEAIGDATVELKPIARVSDTEYKIDGTIMKDGGLETGNSASFNLNFIFTDKTKQEIVLTKKISDFNVTYSNTKVLFNGERHVVTWSNRIWEFDFELTGTCNAEDLDVTVTKTFASKEGIGVEITTTPVVEGNNVKVHARITKGSGEIENDDYVNFYFTFTWKNGSQVVYKQKLDGFQIKAKMGVLSLASPACVRVQASEGSYNIAFAVNTTLLEDAKKISATFINTTGTILNGYSLEQEVVEIDSETGEATFTLKFDVDSPTDYDFASFGLQCNILNSGGGVFETHKIYGLGFIFDLFEEKQIPEEYLNIDEEGIFNGFNVSASVIEDEGYNALVLPSYVTEVPKWVFDSTGHLIPKTITAFRIEESNENEVEVPLVIRSFAFTNCNFLRIVLPKRLKIVEARAFDMDPSIDWTENDMYVDIGSWDRDKLLNDNPFYETNSFYGLGNAEGKVHLICRTEAMVDAYSSLTHTGLPNNCIPSSILPITTGIEGNFNYAVVNGKTYIMSLVDPTSVTETLTIPSKINGEDVYGIAASAFKELACNEVNVEEDSALELIYNGAFYKSKVGKFDFSNATNLKTICTSAFASSSSLVDINLPQSLENIGTWCFFDCQKLENINLSATKVKNIQTCTFNNCKKIDVQDIISNVVKIGIGAFINCSVQKLMIPASVETIGYKAFSGCSLLETVEFASNSSLYFWGEKAFEHSKIMNIRIPSSVQIIAPGAFSNMHMLELLGIVDNQFYYSNNNCLYSGDEENRTLYAIANHVDEIDEKTKVIARGAAEGITFQTSNLVDWSKTEIREIHPYAFNFSNRQSSDSYKLILPNTVESISKYAFNNTALESINLEDLNNLNMIGDYAFYQTKLSGTITVPKNVKYVGDMSFGCLPDIKTFIMNCKARMPHDILFGSQASLETVDLRQVVTQLQEIDELDWNLYSWRYGTGGYQQYGTILVSNVNHIDSWRAKLKACGFKQVDLVGWVFKTQPD